MKIVFASLEKLNFRGTLENVSVIESIEQLRNLTDKNTTYVLAATKEHLIAVENSDNEIYIPSTWLTAEHQTLGRHVYFDLENYPFYQKAKEIISYKDKSKGVFRFRRTVKQDENQSLLVADLVVLSSLLGEIKNIQLKQTDQSVTPSHTIIMMYFEGGTMAHVEYTVTDQERVELEWSGIRKIIEFDSDQMRPIHPGRNTSLPLTYSVDAIIESAHKVNRELVDRLNYFNKLINGGAHL